MQHRENSLPSLWNVLEDAESLQNRFLWSAGAKVSLQELVGGSALGGRSQDLRGASVLVATGNQLTAALALLELDGLARRLILCPPDLQPEHLSSVLETAEVDAIVSDGENPGLDAHGIEVLVDCSSRIAPGRVDHRPSHQTEWILLTSGTTGRPKLVVHTLASLAGAISQVRTPAGPIIWSTFYDIRRYGGLQIFLRTVFTSGSMVFSDSQEPTADFLERASAHRATHILGTPSHWRRAIMSPSANRIAPQYVRLSGEIADQQILNQLRTCYPQARMAHAFASTEAGVVFEVNDGLAGFPETTVNNTDAGVEMKIEDGSLRVRSARVAARYLGKEHNLKDGDGFVDTRDMVELREDRYYFAGRRDGVINVGGFKVHPEEVEAVINRHPHVRMSLVRTRKNPITGAVVVADIVLDRPSDAPSEQIEQLRRELLQLCQKTLPRHKIPAAMNFVPALSLSATGKMARHNA
jgi:acyl-coenzyme A synthetase/AMP-(fatty) acid ligase